MDKKAVSRTLLAIWIIIWAFFLIRPYFKENRLSEYMTLLSLPTEGKKAYITGKDVYDFINFCNESVKKPSTYKIIGLTEDSLESRRAVYYLYPNIYTAVGYPEYLFVYKNKGFHQAGYAVFRKLDQETYILKRVNG